MWCELHSRQDDNHLLVIEMMAIRSHVQSDDDLEDSEYYSSSVLEDKIDIFDSNVASDKSYLKRLVGSIVDHTFI